MTSLLTALFAVALLPLLLLVELVLVAALVCLVLTAVALVQHIEGRGLDLRAGLRRIGRRLRPAGSGRAAAKRPVSASRVQPAEGSAEPASPRARPWEGAAARFATARTAAAQAAAARAASVRSARTAEPPAEPAVAAPVIELPPSVRRPSVDATAADRPSASRDAPTAVLPVTPRATRASPPVRRPGLASTIASRRTGTESDVPAPSGSPGPAAPEPTSKDTALDRLFAPLMESDTTEPLPAPSATKPRQPRRRNAE